MPRTVVPPAQVRGAYAGGAAGGDGLPERLVKYVPAETLAFFVPVAAMIDTGRDALLLTAIAVGVVGTVGYLWIAAQRADPDERPLPHFYVLAVVAFLAWVSGTSPNAAALVGMDPVGAGIVLALAIFLVPLLDEVLTRWLRRVR